MPFKNTQTVSVLKNNRCISWQKGLWTKWGTMFKWEWVLMLRILFIILSTEPSLANKIKYMTTWFSKSQSITLPNVVHTLVEEIKIWGKNIHFSSIMLLLVNLVLAATGVMMWYCGKSWALWLKNSGLNSCSSTS